MDQQTAGSLIQWLARQPAYMVHEQYLEVPGARVKLTCRECHQATVGQILRRERRAYYFGIPLGVERQMLVKCGTCSIEYFTPSLAFDTRELSDVDYFLTFWIAVGALILWAPIFAKQMLPTTR